ncbi:MAG: hypothetical protein GY829_10550 [Gammaproteobacteria bacterium]|nr:hypothetical protein [Gammaproteobacteria bacterium]
MSQSKAAFVLTAQISLFLVLLLTIFYAAPIAGFVWDFANALGYVAVGYFLLLFIFSGKPKTYPLFKGHFFTRFHRDLGFGAFFLTFMHIAILLIKEPLLLEHLKLAAPWYMLSGLVASLIMILIIISSLVRYRGRIWKDYHRFQWVHKWGSIIFCLLIGYHIIGSGFYMNSHYKVILLSIICLVTLIYYVRDQKAKTVDNQARVKSSKYTPTWISISVVILFSMATFLLILLQHEYFSNVTP